MKKTYAAAIAAIIVIAVIGLYRLIEPGRSHTDGTAADAPQLQAPPIADEQPRQESASTIVEAGWNEPAPSETPAVLAASPAPASVAASVYAVQSAAAATERAESDSRPVSIPVLNYHSIGDEPGNSLVLPQKELALQMEYLHEHGFTPLSLADFMLILEKKKAAPAKPVLLTFDDGYADNYTLAMPVLERYGFPATLFMSPGAVSQDGYLNWEQAKAMQAAGWDIQPHSMTHPHLPRLSAEKQKEEIVEAGRLIEEHLGVKPVVFCYPYGEFNKQTLQILKDSGYRYAFTIKQGRTTPDQDPFQLKRIYVDSENSMKIWIRRLGKQQ